MVLAHLSDLHFGRIAHGGIVEALVDEVNAREPALAVLSGDLTQRARHREFAAARALLESLEPPTLVVPGNHDVYPWWRPLRRLATPLRRYKQYITETLAPAFEADGVAVLGLTSAFGATVKGGRIGPGDRRQLRDYFETVSDASFRILVLHHHLTELQSLGPHDVARQARRTLDVAVEQGVQLILCGHLHVSHIEPLKIIPGARRVVVASAGTATSNRWRDPYGPTNFYNLITIEDETFSVEERRYVPEQDRFVSDATTTFERTTR